MMNVSHCCAVLLVLFSVESAVGQLPREFAERSRQDVDTLYALLRRGEVLNELQITPGQQAAIRDSRQESGDLEAERTQKKPSLSPEEIAAFENRVRAVKLTAALACLRPEQVERLEQLSVQYQSLRNGLAQTLDQTLDQTLELSDDQKARTGDLETDLGIELRALMWAGYRRTQRELVALLNSSQSTKWRERVGEDFEFKSVSPGLKPLMGLTLNFYLPAKQSALVDYTMLLYKADVQKELELIDDQLDAATRGNEDANRKLREFSARMEAARSDEVGELNAEILAFQQKLVEEKATARRELLLPHQERRLKELCWRHRSVVDPVQTFDEAVGLSDRQRDQMLVKAQEACKKLTDEMWDFHRSARHQFTEILTPAQRIEWSKLVGQEFKFQSTTKNFQVLVFLR